jgi:hypothetical protein
MEVLRARLAADVPSLERVADDHFALPGGPLPFWETSAAQRPWRSRNGNAASGPA